MEAIAVMLFLIIMLLSAMAMKQKSMAQQIKEITKHMITKEQFDQDLAAFISAFSALVTAIDNSIGQQPQVDLSDEDQQILAAAQTAQAELAKLNPPPPGP